MEDTQSDIRVTRSAIADLHEMLPTYRDQPIESVAEVLQTMLERACREARSAPDGVSVVHDTIESDYNRQIYQLRFIDGERPCTFLGVVADDYDRRTGQPIKVLITVITFKAAKRSILSGRWRNLDGTPIQLPSRRTEPAAVPSTASPAPVPLAAPTSPSSAGSADDPAHVEPPPAVAATVPISPGEPPTIGEVPIGRDGRPKRGYRRGGSTTERDTFVLEILRQDPEAPTMGDHGIHAQVRERFGVGMREAHVAQLRAQLAIERAQLDLARGQVVPSTARLDVRSTPELLAAVGQLLRAQLAVEQAKRSAHEALGRLRLITATSGASTNEV